MISKKIYLLIKLIDVKLILLIVFSLASLFSFRQAKDIEILRYSNNPNAPVWSASKFWLQSAECMRTSGVFLAICENGKFIPVARADDPGHALLLGINSKLQNKILSVVDIIKLNLNINFLGMMCVAILLYAARAYMASFLFIILGPMIYASEVTISPHSSLLGVASFAFILPLTILLSNSSMLSKKLQLLFMSLGFILLGFAALLREPIGMMGFLISTCCLIFLIFQNWRNKKKNTHIVIYIIMVAFFSQTPRWVLNVRDVMFPIEPTDLIQSHGISHNLYLGLGAIDNSFGIRWQDEYADQEVKKIHPNVAYVSTEYFQILWKLYFERVLENPIEVARIYLVKLSKILKENFPIRFIPLWITLLGVIVFLRREIKKSFLNALNFKQAVFIIIISLFFIAFFILQGVLAHHSRLYSEPISVFSLIIICVLLECFVRFKFKNFLIKF